MIVTKHTKKLTVATIGDEILENRRKFKENRQIQLKYRGNIFENSISKSPVLQNLLIGTKMFAVGAIEINIL